MKSLYNAIDLAALYPENVKVLVPTLKLNNVPYDVSNIDCFNRFYNEKAKRWVLFWKTDSYNACFTKIDVTGEHPEGDYILNWRIVKPLFKKIEDKS